MIQLAAATAEKRPASGANQRAMVDFLRARVLEPPACLERFHTIFLDDQFAFLGDAPMGTGGAASLSVRMRDLFGAALNLQARAMIAAHNHPSGQCRPSQYDIDSTRRLKSIADALDIELLDHLIFTRTSVYSMRAGGLL